MVRYMRSFAETLDFTGRLRAFLGYLVPFYVREGKTYLTVGIGCTGGRHRSVFIADELRRSLKIKKAALRVRHRDVYR